MSALPVRIIALAFLLAASPALAEGPTQTASGNVTLSTSQSNTHVLMPGDGTVHVAIDLAATDASSSARLPMNVALVIDRSGSMRGDKIEKTREAARHFVQQLTEVDTLAIISYSDDVRVDLPASKVSSEIKEQALQAIRQIRPGGSTNLSGGLFRGQEEVERHLQNGQVNRVLLMSDGLANRGITDTRALAQQVQKTSQGGISMTTMGVGTDYNEDMMTAVADHSGGNYYFIQESSRIAGVFSTELSKMFATIAQSASVEILLEDGVDLDEVFGYTFTREGDKVTIALAEMFGSQKRSILAKLRVPVVRTGRMPLGSITLRYTDVLNEGEDTTQSLNLAVQVTQDPNLVAANRDQNVEERIGEVQVAQAMTRAANLLRDGRRSEAQRVLREQAVATGSAARGMGGSSRLEGQVQSLQHLEQQFGEADADEAPAAVRSVKARARTLSR